MDDGKSVLISNISLKVTFYFVLFLGTNNLKCFDSHALSFDFRVSGCGALETHLHENSVFAVVNKFLWPFSHDGGQI